MFQSWKFDVDILLLSLVEFYARQIQRAKIVTSVLIKREVEIYLTCINR